MSQETLLVGDENTLAILSTEGALVKEFSAGGVNILFPDQMVKTQNGPKRRGGIPILFPNAGPGPVDGVLSNLPQHGFVRNMEWQTLENTREFFLKLGIRYFDSEVMRIYNNYQFSTQLSVQVEPNKLYETLSVSNEGDVPMPTAPGFHPYFEVLDGEKSKIKTNIPNFDPTRYDFATPRFFPCLDEVILEIPSRGRISIEPSYLFSSLGKLIVWSEPGQNYVCIEPWMGDVNAIVEKPYELTPGQAIDFGLTIKYLG